MKTSQQLLPLIKTQHQLISEGLSRHQITNLQACGKYQRLRRGVYIESSNLTELKPWDRYLLAILAFNMVSPRAVFSHESAAILHGLSVVRTPAKIHMYCSYSSRGSSVGVAKHPRLVPDTATIISSSGCATTDIETTVLDCAKTLPHREAVVIADSTLYLGATEFVKLQEFLLNYSGFNRRKVHRVAGSMSSQSESAGETLVRLLLDEMEIEYEEQVEVNFHGDVFRADFYLPAFGVYLEFDGRIKYTDFGSTTDSLIHERSREKQFLNSGVRVFRTGWQEVYSAPEVFKAQLRHFLGARV